MFATALKSHRYLHSRSMTLTSLNNDPYLYLCLLHRKTPETQTRTNGFETTLAKERPSCCAVNAVFCQVRVLYCRSHCLLDVTQCRFHVAHPSAYDLGPGPRIAHPTQSSVFLSILLFSPMTEVGTASGNRYPVPGTRQLSIISKLRSNQRLSHN